MKTAPYTTQRARWPSQGRHILADYDDASIVVYQAYRPSIAEFALEHQRFGGEWSLGRMTWIKPNFLWMMFRSGWATKPGQEHVLRIRLARAGFDAILAEAVHSSFVREVYETREHWKQRVSRSHVRLQWDPDHGPGGGKVERRAIQLGLRGAFTQRFADEWCLGIEDATPFVREQHRHVLAGRLEAFRLPIERVYPVGDPAVAAKLGLDTPAL